jgi:hypothetical protein
LDSELIPLRRADGRDWDGWIHVNPSLPTPALALLFNSLDQPLTRKITVPLYYAGITNKGKIQINDEPAKVLPLNRSQEAVLEITLPGRSVTYMSASAADEYFDRR